MREAEAAAAAALEAANETPEEAEDEEEPRLERTDTLLQTPGGPQPPDQTPGRQEDSPLHSPGQVAGD